MSTASIESSEIIKLLNSAASLPAAFCSLADRLPQATLYLQAKLAAAAASSSWETITFAQGRSRVAGLASYLSSIGIGKGGKIAIIAATRPEWMIADFAVLSVGGVSVSVYPSLASQDIAYILYDSGAEVVFAENQEQLEKLLALQSAPTHIAETEERKALDWKLSLKKIITFERTQANPLVIHIDDCISSVETNSGGQLEKLLAAGPSRGELASLVYTSGTTGPPKGVMQTHANHLANARQSFESGIFGPDSSMFLMLPLAHSFAKLIGYLAFLSPAPLYFPAIADSKTSRQSAELVSKNMREANAKIIPVVPRLLEKIQEGLLAAAGASDLKGRVLKATLRAAEANVREQRSGIKAPFSSKVIYAATGGIRKKIKQHLFGSNVDVLISGGAKLPSEVCLFFNGIGIPTVEGYGLTETVVACTVGRKGATPVGSVGPVLASDIELRIAADGELLIRGPNVAQGYYNRTIATQKAWNSEGWLMTGDLGSIDEHGNLFITGRKKELIVTSGGKNIAPFVLEEKLKTSPLVSQAVLIGDGRKYCIALVSLNPEEAMRIAKTSDRTVLHTHPEVIKKIRDHMQTCNQGLASFETVKNIFIVPEDFTVDNGLLTPSFKVKRAAVEARYHKEIEAMYLPGSTQESRQPA